MINLRTILHTNRVKRCLPFSYLLGALFLALVACLASGLRPTASSQGNAMSAQPAASLTTDYSAVLGPGLQRYGVEYVWVDEDRQLYLDRLHQLNPNLLRVQISQQFFEPVNDNADPETSAINFGITMPQDLTYNKHVTFQDMFTTLAVEFPEMHFQINVWLAATWNATDPNGYLGLGGAFPPLDYAEHREFIRALAAWLVNDCGIAPQRLSFTFINEPNLDPFFQGTQADLLQMATQTRAALDQVSPQIAMGGLDEVHGLSLTDAFYADPGRGDVCCSMWTFHAYQSGIPNLWSALQSRIDTLNTYGPVWVTEFADTTNGSPDAQMDFSTPAAALGFAELLGRLWSTPLEGLVHFRLSDTYIDNGSPLSGWAGHGLFADWRGTKSSGVAYARYPVFWTFANYYKYIAPGQRLSSSGPAEFALAAARYSDPNPVLALWVTNPSLDSQALSLKLDNFPSASANLEVYDNLSSDQPIDFISLTGQSSAGGYQFLHDLTLPAAASYTLRLVAIPAEPTFTPTSTQTATQTPSPTPTATTGAGLTATATSTPIPPTTSPPPDSGFILYLPLVQ